MSTTTSPQEVITTLQTAFDRYVAVTTTYNKRFIKEWCQALREGDFQPKDEFAYNDDGTVFYSRRLPGWTDEGAISALVWEEIAEGMCPRPQPRTLPPDASLAERHGVVSSHPAESAIELLLPVAIPASSDKPFEEYVRLVRETVAVSPPDVITDLPAPIPFPEEFMQLYSLADTINGPGLPSICPWRVFHPDIEYSMGRVGRKDASQRLDHDIAAGWPISTGDGSNHWTYYAHCRPHSRLEGWAWRVLLHYHGEPPVVFESLEEYLDNESKWVEEALAEPSWRYSHVPRGPHVEYFADERMPWDELFQWRKKHGPLEGSIYNDA